MAGLKPAILMGCGVTVMRLNLQRRALQFENTVSPDGRSAFTQTLSARVDPEELQSSRGHEPNEDPIPHGRSMSWS